MTKQDTIDDSSAPLVEHLAELRNRLIWAVAAFLVGMILCFIVAEPILDFMLNPIEEAMRALGDPNPVMQYTAPQEYFFTLVHISVVAGLMLLAEIKNDAALKGALASLPDHLQAALATDWTPLSDHLVGRKSMFVLGRGPTLAIANEAALKMKETCSVHAEAYSAAEVLHGPVELVEPGFPVLVFNGGGQPEQATTAVARDIAARGGAVFMTGASADGVTMLPVAEAGHPLTDALVQIMICASSALRFCARYSVTLSNQRRGRNATTRTAAACVAARSLEASSWSINWWLGNTMAKRLPDAAALITAKR